MSFVRTHFASLRTVALAACVLALTGLMLYAFTTSIVRAVSDVVRPAAYNPYPHYNL